MLVALVPTPQPPARPARARGRSLRWAASLVALAVVTTAVLVWIAGPEDLVAALRAADTPLLVAAIATQVLALVCFANLYRSAHEAVSGTPRGARSGLVGIAAFGLTQALPGGGAAGALLAIRRFRQLGSPAAVGANVVVHISLSSLTALSLVVTVAASAAALTSGQHASYALLGALVTSGIVGGVTLARRTGAYERVQQRAVTRLLQATARDGRRVAGRWLTTVDVVAVPLLSPRAFARPFAWSITKWSLDLTVLTLAVRAVGGTTPLAAIALSYAAVNLLNSIPLTPGGIGLVEGGITAMLTAFGLDLGSATAATLAYRLVAYWLPLAATIPVALTQVAIARPGERGTSDAPPVPAPAGGPATTTPQPRQLESGTRPEGALGLELPAHVASTVNGTVMTSPSGSRN
jgi:uncharacterized protein (TIRG00374 family)